MGKKLLLICTGATCCIVIALAAQVYAYWSDSLALHCSVPVLYRVEFALTESIPPVEELLMEELPSESSEQDLLEDDGQISSNPVLTDKNNRPDSEEPNTGEQGQSDPGKPSPSDDNPSLTRNTGARPDNSRGQEQSQEQAQEQGQEQGQEQSQGLSQGQAQGEGSSQDQEPGQAGDPTHVQEPEQGTDQDRIQEQPAVQDQTREQANKDDSGKPADSNGETASDEERYSLGFDQGNPGQRAADEQATLPGASEGSGTKASNTDGSGEKALSSVGSDNSADSQTTAAPASNSAPNGNTAEPTGQSGQSDDSGASMTISTGAADHATNETDKADSDR